MRHDAGGWISGPSLPVVLADAGQVRPGDRIVMDGLPADVTDVRHGEWWMDEGRAPGVAIGWEAGSSRGVMFRRADDTVYLVAPEGGEA